MNLTLLDREQLETMLLNPPVVEEHVSLYGAPGLLSESSGTRNQRIHHVLAAAHELLTRIAAQAVLGRELLNSPTLIKEYLRVTFAGAERETFVVVFFDSQNRVIASEEMFLGSTTVTPVYPREVARRALQLNAVSIACAHCHPSSGDPDPSRADQHLTTTLKTALATVDVRLLDHFVVGGNRIVSFAELGLL